MAKVEQIERDIVRVIALSSDGGNLLLLPGENGYLLPSVTVPRWERPTESLAAEMAREWGYEVICIFTPGASLGKEEPYRYQVAECWRSSSFRCPSQCLDDSLIFGARFLW